MICDLTRTQEDNRYRYECATCGIIFYRDKPKNIVRRCELEPKKPDSQVKAQTTRKKPCGCGKKGQRKTGRNNYR